MANIPVALQMYTVRDFCDKDFTGTLTKVAEIGYAGVELAGTWNTPLDKLAAHLENVGLKVVANHTSLAAMEQDFDAVVALHQAVGAKYVVVPMLPKEWRESAEGFRTAATALERAADRLGQAGLRLGYHNHAFEFEVYDGKQGYDILLRTQLTANVACEIDVYWVKYAGLDPVEQIRKYARQTRLLHLKDMADDADRSFAEVGHGTIDFAPIFDVANEIGVEWYVVEQDRCPNRPSIEAVELSFRSLADWGVA